ncbi:protein SPT2 homolog [Diabrotica virgifera virgifera]|uniref:Protein SPT2 homolog n=1 Tax=Diabrotica virgifera virgifera TaxID=50390 RepID=A0A6P7FFI6_DIAVI|nr:protein SPT2 homolog [Diabrotica virgifera virgifera]XP_028132009.1 protein SPT2 homolog [Diabrotica virgifera virgifera]
MDFGQLLHTAQKNEKSKDQRVRYYSTKFEPPKKEKKSERQLSDNIKKFLAKKEAEEKQKAEEARKKRDELLALRSQDKKATKRVNVMLKRTKSANQSVIEDAIDNDNTAVTLAGPMQPDEDDYGYVSQEASQYYTKMMEKYSKMPEEPPKFDMSKKTVSTNLGSTKDRVKAALDREREEALLPHKRKRKHKEKKDDADEEGISYDAPDRSVDEPKSSSDKSDREKMPPPPKPKPKPAPPPMNFADILKIAAQKQHEPVIIEKKEKEEEKPLTKKQRKEMEREKESQMRREERRRQEIMYSKLAKARQKEEKEKEKLGKSDASAKASEKQKPQKNDESSESSKKSSSKNRDSDKTEGKPSSSGREKPEKPKPKSLLSAFKSRPKDEEDPFLEESKPGRKYLPGDMRYKPDQDTKTPAPKKEPEPAKKVSFKTPSNNNNINKMPPAITNSNTQIKKAAPSDPKISRGPLAAKGSMPQKKLAVEPKSKKFPPEDVRRKLPPKLPPKQFPPPDVRRSGSSKMPVAKGGRRILDDDDDEDEYDSDMDDFIDDDDAEADISSHIAEIFGYDRKRYRDVDDDVDDMETSFAQQMKEEVISTKIGIMEDLEEEKKEEEAKRRKMLMKKKMRAS